MFVRLSVSKMRHSKSLHTPQHPQTHHKQIQQTPSTTSKHQDNEILLKETVSVDWTSSSNCMMASITSSSLHTSSSMTQEISRKLMPKARGLMLQVSPHLHPFTSVVQRHCLRAHVEALLLVEARKTTVEVHNHIARVLQMHTQHRVDLQGRNARAHPLSSYPPADPR